MFSSKRCDSQPVIGLEYKVKAAFIYNFAKFIEWPENTFKSKNDPIILCVISNNPESDVFFSLSEKVVGGRSLKVKKCKEFKEIETCHILFIDSTDRTFIRKGLRVVSNKSILTIGHFEWFTEEGGIINFFSQGGQLRFEVNLEAAKQAGLQLGAQLLMSAEIVK